MKIYELTYLISSDISEEELKNLSQKIGSFITEENGHLEKNGESFRKKLAYPVKKRKDAYLAVIAFSLDSEKINDLEKKLKSESRIIRYIILIKKKRKKIKDIILEKALNPEKSNQAQSMEKSAKKNIEAGEKENKKESVSETKKVGLEEIDQKIEEILGE